MCHLLILSPLVQSSDYNLIRIERTNDTKNEAQFIAGGPYQGIVVNKMSSDYEEYPTEFPCSFSVWISSDGGQNLRQEIRSFRFCFYAEVPAANRAELSNRFVRSLFEETFPKDYSNFFKTLLRIMQNDFFQLRAIDVELKFAVGKEQMPMPSAKQLANDGEMENLSSGHVQEALEHAYPNSVQEEVLAFSLRCTLDELQGFLEQLESDGIVEKVPDQPGEWIRKACIVPPPHFVAKNPPKIALITCLFPEKLCVDTIVENSSTEHKYSNTGDSNIFTEGEIAGHRVVATKLSMIGTDREAATSAGSITTRLLGKYQHVEHVIIVGVAGGQAHLTDPEMHIRLGDVVVSDGEIDDDATGRQHGAYVYAYNIESDSKAKEMRFEVQNLSPKVNTLAGAVRNANKENFLGAWHANASSLIDRLNEKHKDQQLDFSRPPSTSDVILQLTKSGNVLVFPHPNESRCTPLYHLGPIGSMVTFYKRPDDDDDGIKKQSPPTAPLKPTNRFGFRKGTQNLNAESNGVGAPKQNTAATLSGDELETDGNAKEKENAGGNISLGSESADGGGTKEVRLVNERLREKFRLNYHLRAFDAGFDSVIAAIEGSRVDSWVLVRGVSDYQQGSSKQGKVWQNYAAANAVALVETILQNISFG
uniref:Nucleoside phosphorylase domain-containing protein n=1 Tax=Globodera rostochiensis TaxID=31243 RepID=A0A914IC73_GLORO